MMRENLTHSNPSLVGVLTKSDLLLGFVARQILAYGMLSYSSAPLEPLKNHRIMVAGGLKNIITENNEKP
jgi:hypothetical protein